MVLDLDGARLHEFGLVFYFSTLYPDVMADDGVNDDATSDGFSFSKIYSLSPFLYPTIGTFTTMAVALLLSLIPSKVVSRNTE